MKRKCKFDKQLSVVSKQLPVISYKTLFTVHCILYFLFTACNQAPKTADNPLITHNSTLKTIYYCPMHPEVQQDYPGTCPKCNGMELVIKQPEDTLANVLKPANASVLANLKTIHPIEQEMPIFVEAQGYIDYDPRYLHNIASRYNGRIDKLYVKQPYQEVRVGQLLMEVYSAEMLTAQKSLIYLLQNDPTATVLIEATEEKLRLQGFTDKEFKQIQQRKEPLLRVPVYSRWNGHVHPGMQNNNTAASETKGSTTNDAMGGMQASNQSNAPSTGAVTPAISIGVREGMYVQRGQTLLNIADPNHVSALIQVQADDMGKIQKGNNVKLIIAGTADSLVTGKVDLIEPIYRNGKKSVTIRVFIDHKGHKCRIGSPLTAVIAGNSVESIWIPATAVVDLGRYQMVWLRHDKALEAHRVQIGIKNGAWIEILNGLTTKDEIAAEAHYLSDSESWVKTVNSDQ